MMFLKQGEREEEIKKSPIYGAAAHGMTEGQKRKISKETGPKKEFISVAEREQQVLNSVPENCREKLETIIRQYRDVFPEKLSKGFTSGLTGPTSD